MEVVNYDIIQYFLYYHFDPYSRDANEIMGRFS